MPGTLPGGSPPTCIFHRCGSCIRTRRNALASLPEARAVCGNAARTDLCGGTGATPFPTATPPHRTRQSKAATALGSGLRPDPKAV
jgi:hypothetical protein